MSFSTRSGAVAPPGATAGALAGRLAGSGRRFEDAARGRLRVAARRLRIRPELAALLALAGVLNLWALSRNGWANDYYSAAVRSMASSWHDFLFASLDPSGVMTVDKPPLALWVQALSVRVFGFHSLSILVPQALMGMASVALVYDLARRRFGRFGGALAGLALALTPISVAVSRHNNPDALLVLCCVAALWCAVRAVERAPQGRGTRWLVISGVCVGLGFETKMGVALTVVPGIAAAWLWLAPAARGRLHALRQLLAGGAALLLVGGAWPALVELVPAADRPWVSGTSDNRVLSLIFEYNGLGRVDGQAGGPGGTANSVFGGATGPLRLLNSALGGQAGWLLGFAAVAAVALLLRTRLRRADPRSGWLLIVGGAFLTTAVLFSFASGIFHPYYVSLLAPFVALLVGAGAAQLRSGRRWARFAAPAAVVLGVAAQLVVLGDYQGQLRWLVPVLIAVGLLAALVLAWRSEARVRLAALGAALLTLMIAPGIWAFDTLGHATSGTFPEGGPGAVSGFGGPGGGRPGGGRPGGFPRGAFAGASGAGGGASGASGASGAGGGASGASGASGAGGGASGTSGASGAGGGASSPSGAAGAPLFGSGSAARSEASGGPAGVGGSEATSGTAAGMPPFAAGAGPPGGFARGAGAPGAAGGGAAGGPGGFGADSLSDEVLSYVKAHGGGTIAVSSQSGAASAILSQDANVAGIGGFSGRESSVSVSWLAAEVKAGRVRWVLDQEAAGGAGSGGGASTLSRGSARAAAGGFGGGPPGDSRPGSRAALQAVARVCRAITLGDSSASSTGAAGAAGGGAAAAGAGAGTLYDCSGRAAQLARAN